MASTPTLKTWQHACVRTITLPSSAPKFDRTVDVEVTNNTDLIYGDPDENVEAQVPSELAGIAERVEFEGFNEKDNLLEKLDKDERIQLSRYRVWLIADRLRRPTLTLKEVRSIPFEDQQAIFRVITHADLAERVMLASFRDLQSGTASSGNGKASGGSSE